MGIDTTSFQSRFGRRMFFLFVACALLPLAALSVFSFQKVTGELRSQRHHLLDEQSKTIGMDILGRLLSARKGLLLVRQVLERGGLPVVDPDAQRLLQENLVPFVHAAVTGPDGTARLLKGLVPQLPWDAVLDRPQSVVLRSAPGQATLGAVYLATGLGKEGRLLVVEFDPVFLWGLDRQADLPHDTDLCVFDDQGEVLLTSLSSPHAVVDRVLGTAETGQRRWMGDGEDGRRLVSWRSLFLGEAFGSRDWWVALTVSEGEALSSLRHFRWTFPLTVLLSFWIILLLCLHFIRGSVLPLQALKTATRSVMAGRFEQPVDIRSGDEFETVGDAFNLMVRRLAGQFAELKTLVGFAQAGSSASDVGAYLQAVLRVIEVQLDYRRFLICLGADDGEGSFRSVAFGFEDRVEELAAAALRLDGTVRWSRNGIPEGAEGRLPWKDVDRTLCGLGVEAAVLLPIRGEGRTLGVLVAADPVSGRSFGHEDESLLGAVSFQIALSQAKITSLRRLETSENRFKSAFEHAAVGIVISDLNGTIQLANQCFADMIGHSRESLSGVPIAAISHPEDAELSPRAFARMLGGEVPYLLLERRYLHKDGHTVWAVLSISVMRDASGGAGSVIAHIQDVTARKRAETETASLKEALIEAQKMEAIGNLAGGIAHDFNNILSAINGYTELALMDVDPAHPAAEWLEAVLKAGGRATDLVRQILAFSRKSEAKMAPVRLAAVVEEVVQLIRASLPATIDIQKNIEEYHAEILGDGSQIHQILMNLCTNAYHAMKPNGGVLRVGLVRRRMDLPRSGETMPLAPGDYLQLTVEDSGCGMDSETVSRIFEPYFTTKGKGEGTGLGLSVVHGIVSDHEGTIAVESEPGAGTTFRLLFPVVEGSGEAGPAPSAKAVKGTGSILLVDDEEMLVTLGSAMIRNLGYRVDGYQDPESALAVFQEAPERYDMVITDLTMPKITGDRLAESILSIRPEIPVLISSGGEVPAAERLAPLGEVGLLPKPITLQALSEALSRYVGEKGKNTPG